MLPVLYVVTPLTTGAVTAGVVNVLLVKVCVPVNVATVLSIEIVTASDPL